MLFLRDPATKSLPYSRPTSVIETCFKGKVPIIIDCDDFAPVESIRVNGRPSQDLGGDMEAGNFKFLRYISERHPKVKITLYTICNPVVKPDGTRFKVWERSLDSRGSYFDLWRGWVKDITKSGQYRLGFHGLHHYNFRNKYNSDYYGLTSTEQALKILRTEIKVRKTAGLWEGITEMAMAFPGWWTNRFIEEALLQVGISFIRGGIKIRTLNGLRIDRRLKDPLLGWKKQYMCLPTLNIRGVHRFVSASTLIDLSAPDLKKIAAKLIEMNSMFTIHTHIASNYGRFKMENGIDLTYLCVDDLLDYIENHFRDKILYVFPSEVASSILKHYKNLACE